MHVSQCAFPMKIGKGRSQKPHFGGGIGEVYVLCDVHRIRSTSNQFHCELEGMCVSAGKTERSCIGKHSRVEAGCHLGCHSGAGTTCQPKNHFGNGARAAIDPIHVGELTRAAVVIDVDEKPAFETG